MKKCPYCAELIQNDAVYCRHCNHKLEGYSNKSIQENNFLNDSGFSEIEIQVLGPLLNDKKIIWFLSFMKGFFLLMEKNDNVFENSREFNKIETHKHINSLKDQLKLIGQEGKKLRKITKEIIKSLKYLEKMFINASKWGELMREYSNDFSDHRFQLKSQEHQKLNRFYAVEHDKLFGKNLMLLVSRLGLKENQLEKILDTYQQR